MAPTVTITTLRELHALVRDGFGEQRVELRSIPALRDAPAMYRIVSTLAADYDWKVAPDHHQLERLAGLADLARVLNTILKVNLPQLKLHLVDFDQRRGLLRDLAGLRTAAAMSTAGSGELLMQRHSRLTELILGRVLGKSLEAMALTARVGLPDDHPIPARVKELDDLVQNDIANGVRAEVLPDAIQGQIAAATTRIKHLLGLRVDF
uniref:Uncharacterized protein n=1 Tax=Leersia perrieri TaxID=77586 RepID=A0A0D9XFF5_9ORYZ